MAIHSSILAIVQTFWKLLRLKNSIGTISNYTKTIGKNQDLWSP